MPQDTPKKIQGKKMGKSPLEGVLLKINLSTEHTFGDGVKHGIIVSLKNCNFGMDYGEHQSR